MEHRWRKRCPLSLDVVVHGRDGLNVPGKTRDVSADGMYIQLAQRVISASSAVEIEFSHN